MRRALLFLYRAVNVLGMINKNPQKTMQSARRIISRFKEQNGTVICKEGTDASSTKDSNTHPAFGYKHMRMSNSYVIPVKIARTFPARPERHRLRHCRTPMVLCRFFM